jgi:hypothetical protein
MFSPLFHRQRFPCMEELARRVRRVHRDGDRRRGRIGLRNRRERSRKQENRECPTAKKRSWVRDIQWASFRGANRSRSRRERARRRAFALVDAFHSKAILTPYCRWQDNSNPGFPSYPSDGGLFPYSLWKARCLCPVCGPSGIACFVIGHK